MGTKNRILFVIAFFLTIFALAAFISLSFGVGIILMSIVLAIFLNSVVKMQKIVIASIIWALDLIILVVLKSKLQQNTDLEGAIFIIGFLTIPLMIYWIIIFIKNGKKYDDKNNK